MGNLKALREVVGKFIAAKATTIVFDDQSASAQTEELLMTTPFEFFESPVAFNARLLQTTLSNFDDDADIRETAKNYIITQGERSAKISKIELTKVPLFDVPIEWLEVTEQLSQTFSQASKSVSKNHHVHALTCIHVTKDFIEGCDGYQLYRCYGDYGISGLFSLQAAQNILPGAKVGTTANHLIIDHNGVLSAFARFNQPYPKLDKLLNVENGSYLEFSEELAQALQRCSTLCKSDHEIQITFSENCCEINSTSEGSSYKEQVKVLYTSDEPKVLKLPIKLFRRLNSLGNSCLITQNAMILQGESFQYAISIESM
tara:strand:+ start:4762 stop:5709 length:948 start_codon:yes stop_codon:yes gene_type:complete